MKPERPPDAYHLFWLVILTTLFAWIAATWIGDNPFREADEQAHEWAIEQAKKMAVEQERLRNRRMVDFKLVGW